MNQANIRNFCIIAHIDHGKSTLADRLLEFTGTIEKRKMKEQLLDQMDLERERGITIKLQPVQMHYTYPQPTTHNPQQNAGETDSSEKSSKLSVVGGRLSSSEYILNLIDTPGHVDFHYEVSRSLAAVEGAILLVDATKGVQAQTLANLYLAIEQGLEIIPVVNKIDLPNAEVEQTKKAIIKLLGCAEADVILASGKTGIGIEEILKRVVKVVPPPLGSTEKTLRALIFDSVYNTYKGVVAYVKVVDGELKREDRLYLLSTEKEGISIEVGKFKPELVEKDVLKAGEIGYVATGLKEVGDCRVGDTITLAASNKGVSRPEPLPGYKEIKPAVYASFYPVEGDDYAVMRDALEKLKLNDAAFVFEPESNIALGRGFRCGFLGLLHLEIIQARLDREFNLHPTITTPSVVYELTLHGDTPDTPRLALYSPTALPDPASIESIAEPYVLLTIVTPATYLGGVMSLANNIRATYKNTEYLDEERILLSFEAPLSDVIVNFHDDLKSVTAGYASMNYEPIGYRKSEIVKLDIMIAGDRIDAFARMIPRALAFAEGKRVVEKLKEVIPRQNFAVAIQAAVGGKIIARETISAYRKDVTGKLYGGDFSRKKKLLEKQKKGKKKAHDIGKVTIPGEAFLAVLRK